MGLTPQFAGENKGMGRTGDKEKNGTNNVASALSPSLASTLAD
jgi:hypothetical protein